MYTKEYYKYIDRLILLYLSCELDKVSIAELKQWVMKSESNRIYVKNQIEIWFSAGASDISTAFNKDKAFELFKQRVAEDKKEKKHIRRFSWKIVYRTAVIILILLLPWTTYWYGRESIKNTFADMMVEAPIGSRIKLYLPDGTLVWLNAGSKITYSQGFGVDDRKLTLDGEGYFEVTHNKNIPLEVKTNELNVTVLGTVFNFKNYPDDKEVTVNLMEGKVALHNKLIEMPELYLEPNKKVSLNKLTGKMVKSITNMEYTNAWVNNELFFDEELLDDIAKKLMRNYGVKIEVGDSLRNKRFYGSFKIEGNTITEVLDAMATTNRMKYRYENGKYILY